jgi:D-glucosaminate-6-phosphate ammonia-lyase
MSQLAFLNVRPLINAAGPVTRLGGGPLSADVRAAMAEAASTALHIGELQAAAGAYIAQVTGAQAGYVTSGSAAGLTLSAAACIARLDPALMDRLPDTTGLPNEIIVQKPHQVAYNHALAAAGARLVEVGYMGYPGQGATYAWQIEAAITSRTVAVAFQLVDAPNTVPLEAVVQLAHAHDLPVILDGAGALPPADNLRRFIDLGVDLVSYSGGKAIGGPQASGILCGRADLIRSVGLQHQDMDVHPETWELRQTVHAIPHHGIGRSMKVGKEEIVGLVAALRAYAARDHVADHTRWKKQLQHIAAGLEDVAGARCELVEERAIPRLEVHVGAHARALAMIRALDAGEPRVAVAQYGLDDGFLIVNPHVLQPGEEEIVLRRLLDELRDLRRPAARPT